MGGPELKRKEEITKDFGFLDTTKGRTLITLLNHEVVYNKYSVRDIEVLINTVVSADYLFTLLYSHHKERQSLRYYPLSISAVVYIWRYTQTNKWPLVLIT